MGLFERPSYPFRLDNPDSLLCDILKSATGGDFIQHVPQRSGFSYTQLIFCYTIAFSKYKRSFNHVFQFSHIPLPSVLLEHIHGRRCKFPGIDIHLCRKYGNKMLGKRGDILGPFTQGRYRNGEHAYPVVEILSEPVFSDSFFEVHVTGCNYSDINYYRG